jgi:hypothetical protein
LLYYKKIDKLYLEVSDSKNLPAKKVIGDLIQTMEKSNYLKKKARIVEGGIIRAEIHEANVLLKSSELVLCVAGLYHLLKGWQGPESPVNLSDIRLFIPA